ncbi:ABC transporter ATP-binding protein, partial [Histophilus somni]|uniref:ABC transporter ATP-binding protein n=1 Tax=Histophilus somni TaxID=731 RepID=UPI00201EB8E6
RYIGFWFIIRQVIFALPDPISYRQGTGFGLLALISTILSIGLYTLALVLSHLAAFRTSKNMKKEALKHVVRLPMGYFLANRSSKIRQQIDINTQAVEVFIAHQLPDLAGAFTLPIAVVVMLLFFDWRLGLLSLLMVFVAFIMVSLLMTKEQRQVVIDFEKQKEHMASSALEYVRGMPVVKVFQQTVFTFRNFYKEIMAYRKIAYKLCQGLKFGTSLYNLMLNSIYIFLLLGGIFLYQRSPEPSVFIVDLIFYLMLVAIFPNMLSKIMKVSDDLMKVKEAKGNFDSLMAEEPLSQASNPKKPKDFSISFKNVSFSYPNANEKAISNFSFECKQGETIALVGPSGGGKSTVAKFLSRFYEPSEGSIKIGNIDIRDMAKEDLMNTVSFVFQDTKIMEGSIAENIARGCGEVSREDILQAALKAQCKDIIDKLPQGLDTPYGAKGVYLSGGECQRLAIANSILRDTPIVVLD